MMCQKPIGARARRIEELVLVIYSDKSERIVITSSEQLFDYSNPMLPGALLKAALVCTGIVQQHSRLSFQQQLQEVSVVLFTFHSILIA